MFEGRTAHAAPLRWTHADRRRDRRRLDAFRMNPHFGKLADVWKHLPLDELLVAEQPTRYWETHAGSANYVLTRSPERAYGIYWVLDHLDRSELVKASAYVRLLKALPHANGYPKRYPGSAMQAMLLLGLNAHYLLCDHDPESARDLEEGARSAGVADLADCRNADGRDAVASAIESVEDASTIFVHIDPFDSFERSADGLSTLDVMNLLARSGAKVLYWYGYEETSDRGWILDSVEGARSVWAGDILLPERDESGLLGCGVLCLNMSEEGRLRCTHLGRALEHTYENALLPSGRFGSVSFREMTRRG